MQEALLQYIWKNNLFCKEVYKSDNGESVEIIDPGKHNMDGGPDFINARIRIDNTLWAGNVEIHKQASEWYKHNHNKNAAYNNVVLHVVIKMDSICYNEAGRQISTIEIKYDKNIEEKYQCLLNTKDNIPCHKSIHIIDRSLLSFWLSALTIERLQSKINRIEELFDFTKNNWEQTLYTLLAQSFGLKINALPFEMLAKKLPHKIVTQYSDNLMQLEALFFGQAGMLKEDNIDEYHEKLKNEYKYLSSKYDLKPLETQIWQHLRLRPKNFPTIRIAQFCSLMNKSGQLLSHIIECKTMEELYNFFNCKVSDYWTNHYAFGKTFNHATGRLGKDKSDSIIINSIVPFLFMYGQKKYDYQISDRAIRFLEVLAPENNHITQLWARNYIVCRNASESQALIELYTNYCNTRRCLDCQIGHLIIAR
jgi:hypothetical protein